MQDLRFALRAFRRTPGTSSLVVITLAVAIAAATIIASTIDMVWRFIPTERTDGLVFVASTDPRPEQSQSGVAGGLARTGVSIPDLVDWTERTSSFQEFAGVTFQSAIMTGADAPSRISTARATDNLPRVWGIAPQLGRAFEAGDAAPGAPRVVLLSHDFWQRQFSGGRDVAGRSMTIDGQPHTIVGVLPAPTGRGMFKAIDVMVPLVLDRERERRDDRRLYVTGVLKPGVAREQAEADLARVARQLQSDYPRTNARNGVVVRPMLEMLGANIAAVLLLLSSVAFMVVCIACANVASIILAQVATRRRELAVRAAMGAGRWRQIRQFMVESLVTASIAGAAGLFLAGWGLAVIRFASEGIDGFSDMGLNGRVLAVSLALTLLAPLGFALLPAIRMSSPDMEELRQGTRGAETRRGRWLRESLVVPQVALALVLMMQVAFIGRVTWRLHNMDRGFDSEQVLTFRMNLTEAAYPDGAATQRFYTSALERIRSVPGVAGAAATNRLPVTDRQIAAPFVIQGKPVPPSDAQPQAAQVAISAGYLQTMKIPLLQGRGFVEADYNNAPPVALVSREAARQYWPGQNPIGQRIAFTDRQNEWLEVVGIADDVRNTGPDLAVTPQIYVPGSWRSERAAAFVVRSATTDPVQLAPAIRAEIARLDKTQPIYDFRSMRRLFVEDLGGTYLFTGMLGVFAIVALLLAAAGVYGLISFSVSQRAREIGVRMALGAEPRSILGMVIVRGSVPLTLGLFLGSAGAAALVSVTASALQQVDVRDPLAYLTVAVPLALVTFVATYIPARRATQVDPLVALRAE